MLRALILERRRYQRSAPLITLLIFALTTLASTQQDQVNERIPVTPTELEKHWRIDCGALWNALASVHADCPLPDDALRTLELCSFIHQPPGETTLSGCPDYGGALERARRSTQSACKAVLDFAQARPDCPLAPADKR